MIVGTLFYLHIFDGWREGEKARRREEVINFHLHFLAMTEAFGIRVRSIDGLTNHY